MRLFPLYIYLFGMQSHQIGFQGRGDESNQRMMDCQEAPHSILDQLWSQAFAGYDRQEPSCLLRFSSSLSSSPSLSSLLSSLLSELSVFSSKLLILSADTFIDSFFINKYNIGRHLCLSVLPRYKIYFMLINYFILLGSSELCRILNLCPVGWPTAVNSHKPDIFRTSPPIKSMFGKPEYFGTHPDGRTSAPGIFREPHNKVKWPVLTVAINAKYPSYW